MGTGDISVLAGGKELFNKVTKSPLGLSNVSAEQWLLGAFSTAHGSYRKQFMCREEVRVATISPTVSCREDERRRFASNTV